MTFSGISSASLGWEGALSVRLCANRYLFHMVKLDGKIVQFAVPNKIVDFGVNKIKAHKEVTYKKLIKTAKKLIETEAMNSISDFWLIRSFRQPASRRGILVTSQLHMSVDKRKIWKHLRSSSCSLTKIV